MNIGYDINVIGVCCFVLGVYKKKMVLKANQRYKEALKMKPDFYQGLVALWQQKFEYAQFLSILQLIAMLIWQCGLLKRFYRFITKLTTICNYNI